MAILPWNSTKLWQRVFSCIRSASVKPTHYAQLLCFKSDLQVMKSRHRRRDQVNSDWISDIVATVLVRHFSSFHWGFWYSVVFPSCCRNHFWVLRNLLVILTVGTLRSKDADDNENVKKTIGLISKTTTSHVHHTFLYISFPFLHDYDVKMPNFAFYGGRKQATTKFYFSYCTRIWCLEIQLQEGSPTFDQVSG